MNRIVAFDPVDHRDVPDTALDILDATPVKRIPRALARIVACDPEDLSGYTMGVLVGALCHTLVSVGEGVAQWARDPSTGVRPEQVEHLLHLVGRRNLRDVLLRELETAYNGAERRQQHRHSRGGDHADTPPAQRHRGAPAGHRGSASGSY